MLHRRGHERAMLAAVLDPHRIVKRLQAVWVLVSLAVFQPPAANGQAPVIDAPGAQGLVAAGGLLVDIRTSGELVATGLPEGAVRVPLQGDDMRFNQRFADEVAAAAGDKVRPVALIDANGRRSMVAARLLIGQGFEQVYAVGEGMIGSNFGPGWLARKLPTTPCRDCGG